MGIKDRFFYQMTSFNPEVTGSGHLVSVHYPNGALSRFLTDCGLYQEEKYNHLNNEPLQFDSKDIEFVLITHNHADHMGRLPLMIKDGFHGKIYTTKETAAMMPIALRDSFKIHKEDSKKHNRKLLYEEEHLEETIRRIVPCEFNETEYVSKNIKVTFSMNGHLLGAGMITVQISYPGEEDRNIFFMGDYKPYNVFFELEDVPRWVYDLPITVITESTYGYMDSHQVKYHMEDDLEKAINAGKTILISAFAQGRAQEVLFLLKYMQIQKKLSKEIPIRLDGNLARADTLLYLKSELLNKFNKADFLPANFSFVTKEEREAVLSYSGQQIILSTSGMMDHGPAQFYLERFVERKDVLIYIPGYTSPGTLGYKLQHPNQGNVKINGREYQMKATVMTTNECSSHAKADEIIDFLLRFKHLNLVLVNHGQKEVKDRFALRILEEVKPKRVEILGEHTFCVGQYGYMKHYGAKLDFKPPKQSEKPKEKRKEKRQFFKKIRRSVVYR